MANAVAGSALRRKDVLPFIQVERLRLGVVPGRSWLLVFPITQEVADHERQEAGIVGGSVPHPLASRDIADHEVRGVTVPPPIRRIQSQLLSDQFYIGLLAGEEEPPRSGMELLCVGFHFRRTVMIGINADRVEEDIFSHAIAEHLLDLGEPCSLQRAGVLTMGVDEINGNDLVSQQIIVEMHDLSILSSERNIGEVIGSPMTLGLGGAEGNEDRNCYEQSGEYR